MAFDPAEYLGKRDREKEQAPADSAGFDPSAYLSDSVSSSAPFQAPESIIDQEIGYQ
jgi:hypothetical protein